MWSILEYKPKNALKKLLSMIYVQREKYERYRREGMEPSTKEGKLVSLDEPANGCNAASNQFCKQLSHVQKEQFPTRDVNSRQPMIFVLVTSVQTL